MVGVCGWLGRKSIPSQEAAVGAAARRLAPAGPFAVSPEGNIAAAGTASTAAVVDRDLAGIAVCGHPRWIGRLAPSLPELATELIVALRERDPGAVLRSLSGDFALVFDDRRSGRGIIAVDRFSIRRLAYVARGQSLFFASTLDTLFTCVGSQGELDPQSIYDYVFFHVVPSPGSIYRGVRFVPAGHYLAFEHDGRITERCYWRAEFKEDGNAPFEELKGRFLDALQAATDAASREVHSGSFLSGGTDSSTISGMLGRVKGAPPATFSIGFDAKGYDEMEFARIAARHFGTRHHEYYVTPEDVVAAIPRIAAHYDQPFGNSSAVPTLHCARLAAEHGVERLLAGDGGDELFGGNARYAKQQLFAYYEWVPAAIRRTLVEPLVMRSSFTARVPLLRKVRRYVEQAIVPMPRRYESGNPVEYIGAEAIFERDFLAAVDRGRPHALMREAHAPFAGYSLINQMLGIDFRVTLADNDLPKVTRMCELAGVDVVFPMLEAPVVDLAAELPPYFKLRGTQLRWFFKQALREFLPPQILQKKKHGFGLPVGAWLLTHSPLFALAQSGLEALRKRGIVRQGFANDLTTRLLHEHPPYYGGLLWVLMMLGIWLDSRRL